MIQGSFEAPILAHGGLWSADSAGGTLMQLSPADEWLRNQVPLPAPAAAGGKVFVASDHNVLAFGA